MVVKELLSKGINSSDLIEVKLSNSKSHIILNNKGKIYCSVYKGLSGLFRKDTQETGDFGRKTCDEVKARLGNHGFFTSDELPHYGITREEINEIYEKTGASRGDLIAFFAYGKEEAEKTKRLLNKVLARF